MTNKRGFLHLTILIFIVLSAGLVIYTQVPSPTNSVAPSPAAPNANQPSDSQNIKAQPSAVPASVTPTPSNEKGLITPEMVTALGGLWMWGVILIVCFVLFIFRRELRSLVKKAEQAETLHIGAPGVNLQIGKPLADKIVEATLSEEKAAPPSQQKETAELAGKRESESLPAEKTIEDLRDELQEAIATNEEGNVQSAYETLQAATTDQLDRVVNEALYLRHRFKQGDTSAIPKLQKLTENERVSSVAYFCIGSCYEDVGDINKALEAYRLAVKRTVSKDAKAYRVIVLANCLLKAEKKSEAYKLVSGEISKTDDPEILLILYRGLASLYKTDKNPLREAFALGKALEYEPNNVSLLFDLAYAYSGADLHPLSLLHYERLLRFDKDNSSALNNVAVEYEKLEMPMLSVASYKKAVELNETLASANLAYRLMNAGFAEEASEILENAKHHANPHPNVGSASSALSKKQSGETNKKQTLIDNAIKQQQFLRIFSETYFLNLNAEDENLVGAWQLEDETDVEVAQDESIVTANWLVFGKKHQFTGTVSNRTLRLTKQKMEYSWYDNSENGFKDEYSGYAYLSEDSHRLSIMYVHANEPIFVTMVKKENGEAMVAVPS